MIETLKGLPLINQTSTPVPAAVQTFYNTTLAKGSGPNGTILLTDILGTAAGIPANEALTDAVTIIGNLLADGSLAVLNGIYSDMANVVTSVYGIPPTIVIPSGPAAGTYADYESAVLACISAADVAIGVIISANAVAVATMNASWFAMAENFCVEPVLQNLASIDWTIIPVNAQLPITAFVTGIDGFGQNTEQGQSADFLEAVADVTNQYGQALIGAMREGRNKLALNSANIRPNNQVPDTPLTPPPEAQLTNGEYTPAEARALVRSNLTS